MKGLGTEILMETTDVLVRYTNLQLDYLISVIDFQCSLSAQLSSLAHNLKGHASFFPPT